VTAQHGARATESDGTPGPTEWQMLTPGVAEPVGVGPHPLPWPTESHYDADLLANGDQRNVVDRYRYWTRAAIVADLDERRFPLQVAIENFGHDHNIGTVVRTANAFAVARVHIVGRRRWNRRGAMVTDRYQHLDHHEDIAGLVAFAAANDLVIVAVDNVPGSVPLETTELPVRSLLLFGAEGPGLTPAARAAAAMSVSIAQFGSTRSINAGVAAGIAMHSWIRQHGGQRGAD
jgi:tRNA G18 (ribose-2'-O)-methylase SpoU